MDNVNQNVKLAYVTSWMKFQGFLFLFSKHHSGYTPLFVDSGAARLIFPAPSAALSTFAHQMGLQGFSHLTLQPPSCSRVEAGSFLRFPSLPISCLLSLPPVPPAPSLLFKISYHTKHWHPHPGMPKKIPPSRRDTAHPRQ